ncbi:MAG TPA: LysE family translocator [Candidatus Acidoferrales bacterium]|nr:LysE family translocator [Candidatus Acidoferrales bacterium]
MRDPMTVGHALLAFTAAAGLLTITPGLDTALVLRTGAVEGSRRAMLAGVGICFGCLTWGFAASVGLGALLAVSTIAYNTLRVAGACYLILLGVKLVLRKPASVSAMEETSLHSAQAPDTGASAPAWFIRGFLTNILNPKVGVFYVTFLPQFIPAGVHVTSFSMLLAAIHATEGILWFLLLTLATRPLSAWLRRPRVTRTLDRATAVMLIGFGVRLVLDKRR